MGLGSNQSVTPKLHSLQVTQSIYGIVIPIMAGTVRLPANLLWYGDFNSGGSAYNLGGKGLGKGATQYDYVASILGALCHGPVVGIGNVWGQNGRLTLQSVTEAYTVPSGGGSYTVNNQSAFNQDLGVGVVTPYSVTANDYGSPGSVTLTGNTVAATNNYTQSAGTYTFPSALGGQQVQISYSFSLYVVGATEDYNIPSTTPYEITVENQPEFRTDEGVIFVATGNPLSPVGGTPSVSGTYNPNGGNYLFAPADAGKAVAISYQWKQSQSNINPSATFSFTLLNGAQNQTPWSYLTSRHLSQAIGYTTIACIAADAMDLGPSGQMQNYNYEVLGPFQFGAGIVDADCAVWIQNFLQNQLWGVKFLGTIDASLTSIAQDYWDANSFFISPLLDSARPAADYISEWCEAGNVGVYWSDNSLKFIPYGDTTQVGNGYTFSPQTAPVVDLDDTDFIVEGDEDPVEIERTPWQDAFNEVHIQFNNRINNYNDDSVVLQDDSAVALFGLRPEGQKDYSFLKTIAAANFAANIRLKRLVNIRKAYSFKISGIRYPFLEPMDMVTLTDVVTGLSKTPARITEISEGDNRVYTVRAEEFPWGTATATLYPKQPAALPPPLPMMSQPGDTTPIEIFEPPSGIATTVANSPYQIWMALTGGPNWGGCKVMMSLDGTSYEEIGNGQTGTSRGGTITAALPHGSDPDTTDTLSVATTGQLFNVSKQQADAYATLCKVGLEYLSYQNAALTGSDSQTNDYDLTYLRRGAFSTPNVAHSVGEDFIRIDSQLFQYSYNPALRGMTVYFKFLSFNLLNQMLQGLGDVSAYAYVVGGNNASQNMTLTPVSAGGGSWNIEVYELGQSPGTNGQATLPTGAVITLPAATLTGFTAGTTYFVGYNLTSSAYQTFTTESNYLAALSLGNMVGIGSTTIPSGTAFLAANPGFTTQADGTLIEWGTAPVSGTISGSVTAGFPETPLPSYEAVIACTFGSTDRITYIPGYNQYYATIANNGAGVAANWIAFGGPSTNTTTLTDGTVIQWGVTPSISGSLRVNFYSTMPVSNPCVIVITEGPTDRIAYVSSVDSGGFTVANNGSGCGVFWVAFSAASGSSALANGMLIKWGQTGTISGSTTVTFASAFPSNGWVGCASTYGGTDRITYITSVSSTAITIANNGSGVQANWMVIGD